MGRGVWGGATALGSLGGGKEGLRQCGGGGGGSARFSHLSSPNPPAAPARTHKQTDIQIRNSEYCSISCDERNSYGFVLVGDKEVQRCLFGVLVAASGGRTQETVEVC